MIFDRQESADVRKDSLAPLAIHEITMWYDDIHCAVDMTNLMHVLYICICMMTRLNNILTPLSLIRAK